VIIENVTNEQYHADRTAISASMLSDYLFKPTEFHDKWILGGKEREPRKGYLDIGTATHTRVLETAKFKETVREIPPYIKSRRGKVWDAFRADNPDMLLLRSNELEAVRRMSDSLFKKAGDWLRDPGPVETTIKWRHTATGLWLKCRPDKLIFREGRVLVLDLKTIHRNIAYVFSKHYRDFGYGIQEVHYCEGVRQQYRVQPVHRFLVVQSSDPYVARTYSSLLHERRRAEAERERALREIAEKYPQFVKAA
jgi:hypothetical protein